RDAGELTGDERAGGDEVAVTLVRARVRAVEAGLAGLAEVVVVADAVEQELHPVPQEPPLADARGTGNGDAARPPGVAVRLSRGVRAWEGGREGGDVVGVRKGGDGARRRVGGEEREIVDLTGVARGAATALGGARPRASARVPAPGVRRVVEAREVERRRVR